MLSANEGADLNHPDSLGRSALKKEIVQMLFATDGVDLDSQDSHGQSAIPYSAGYGLDDVVQALLRRGAAPDTRDNFGRTALSCVTANGHVRVTQMLLDTG